jgi:hypothetical protein
MQKTIRINEPQLLYLSSKARVENTLSGTLWKRSTDIGKWQQRWFALYQNLLFYYECDTSPRPSGVALLEGCYCERIVSPGLTIGKGRDYDKQVGWLNALSSEIIVILFAVDKQSSLHPAVLLAFSVCGLV